MVKRSDLILDSDCMSKRCLKGASCTKQRQSTVEERTVAFILAPESHTMTHENVADETQFSGSAVKFHAMAHEGEVETRGNTMV